MRARGLRSRALVVTALSALAMTLTAAAAATSGQRATITMAGTPSSPSAPKPACTRREARTLIPRTRVGAHFLKLVNGNAWSILQFGCLKLMGGSRRDMVALVSCCTAASPTPLFIFRPTATGWKVTYARSKPLIAEIGRLGSTLIEKRPIYHRSTPLCCPAGYTYWSLAYRQRRWVVARTTKPS
jgi:hypothetical protein